MNTLIEQLRLCGKTGCECADDAITALSPTMPDDVAEMYAELSSMAVHTNSPFLMKAADLLERQEQQLQWWITQTKANQADYLKAQRKIEQLEAEIKEWESGALQRGWREQRAERNE